MDYMKIVYGLVCVFCIVMISSVLIYNGFDKRSFRIERLCRKYKEKLDEWADITGQLAAAMPTLCAPEAAGLAGEFKGAKNCRRRTELASALIQATRRLPGALPGDDYEDLLLRREKAENALAEFSDYYSNLRQDYNNRLKTPVLSLVARLLKLRPFPEILFFSSAERR